MPSTGHLQDVGPKKWDCQFCCVKEGLPDTVPNDEGKLPPHFDVL